MFYETVTICTSWTVTRTRCHFLQSAISLSLQSDPGEERTFSRKKRCHADDIIKAHINRTQSLPRKLDCYSNSTLFYHISHCFQRCVSHIVWQCVLTFLANKRIWMNEWMNDESIAIRLLTISFSVSPCFTRRWPYVLVYTSVTQGRTDGHQPTVSTALRIGR